MGKRRLLRGCPGFRTAAAGSVKIRYMPCNVAVKVCSGKLCNALDIAHLQIHYSAAFRADKVIVGRGIGVKVIYAVTYTQAGYFTDIR